MIIPHLTKVILLLFSFWLMQWSQDASAEPQNSTEPQTNTETLLAAAHKRGIKQQKDLTKYLKDTSNQRWLTTASGQEFLSLFLADQTGEKLGLVLLLSGSGHLPTQPNSLEYLRTKLPEFGWATLSIGLLNDELLFQASFSESATNQKNKEPNSPPNDGSQNAPEPQTTTALFDPRQISDSFQQRLTAALPIIENTAPQRTHIITTGISGLWLFEALQNEMPTPPVNSIIMIDAYQPMSYSNTNLTQVSIGMPHNLLDITKTHPESIRQAQFRMIRAKQQQKLNYRRVKLEGFTAPVIKNENLLRTVVGWMKKLSKEERE